MALVWALSRVKQRALVDEGLLELALLLAGSEAERIEELDRDGQAPDRVHRAVDDREAAFAHEAFDLILVGDRAADECERIRSVHDERETRPLTFRVLAAKPIACPSAEAARIFGAWAGQLALATGGIGVRP